MVTFQSPSNLVAGSAKAPCTPTRRATKSRRVRRCMIRIFHAEDHTMATFLVAHGAWSAGWAWKKMRPLLRARGHELHTPTHTGLGLSLIHISEPTRRTPISYA